MWLIMLRVNHFSIGWLTALLPIFSTQSFTFSDKDTHMLILCLNPSPVKQILKIVYDDNR